MGRSSQELHWLRLAGFGWLWLGWLARLGFGSLSLGFVLIWLDFGWIWFDFGLILVGFRLDFGWIGLGFGLDFKLSLAFTRKFVYSGISTGSHSPRGLPRTS